MAFWRLGRGESKDAISEARRKARRAIDSENAQKTFALLTSSNPIEALATSLEYNLNWGCCKKVDPLTNVPKGLPGRLQTLGDTQFFCSHCDFEASFDLGYFENWYESPNLSTAGARREPPTPEREGRDGGYEAVECAERALIALERDDVGSYLELLNGSDRTGPRVVMKKLEYILAERTAEEVSETLEAAKEKLGHFRDYQNLAAELRARRVTAASGSGTAERSESAREALIDAEDLTAKAMAGGKDQLNLGAEHFPELRDLPANIAQYDALKILRLNGSRIEDLSPLSQLPVLESLYLDDAAFIDLAALSKLPRLKSLSLKRTALSDLKGFEALENLSSLSIDETAV